MGALASEFLTKFMSASYDSYSFACSLAGTRSSLAHEFIGSKFFMAYAALDGLGMSHG